MYVYVIHSHSLPDNNTTHLHTKHTHCTLSQHSAHSTLGQRRGVVQRRRVHRPPLECRRLFDERQVGGEEVVGVKGRGDDVPALLAPLQVAVPEPGRHLCHTGGAAGGNPWRSVARALLKEMPWGVAAHGLACGGTCARGVGEGQPDLSRVRPDVERHHAVFGGPSRFRRRGRCTTVVQSQLGDAHRHRHVMRFPLVAPTWREPGEQCPSNVTGRVRLAATNDGVMK